ncbi:MAG: hypothetical protein U1F63_05145 [Chitinivorax sp.]|mgnify:CR=1 FL=1
MNNWQTFPHDSSRYDYAGDALRAHWEQLHRGDREHYPDRNYVQAMLTRYPALQHSISDIEQTASGLQQAWRLYHLGRFGEAFEQAETLGPIAVTCAAKSLGIYATYLIDDEKQKLTLFKRIIGVCEQAQQAMPEHANAWYFHAYSVGRYGQTISVAQALAEGLGGKIRHSLEKALKLQPDHAEAHIAMGAFQAEVIDKVGALVGGLTYGAKKDSSVEHFATALELLPDSAIARIEMAEGLMLLFGNKRMDDATRLYNEAAECVAHDAMEALDAERAQAALE